MVYIIGLSLNLCSCDLTLEFLLSKTRYSTGPDLLPSPAVNDIVTSWSNQTIHALHFLCHHIYIYYHLLLISLAPQCKVIILLTFFQISTFHHSHFLFADAKINDFSVILAPVFIILWTSIPACTWDRVAAPVVSSATSWCNECESSEYIDPRPKGNRHQAVCSLDSSRQKEPGKCRKCRHWPPISRCTPRSRHGCSPKVWF